MATIALQVAGSALGQFLGGPMGAAIGSAIGATAGSMIDRAVLGSGQRTQYGPRLNDLDCVSASEGAAIPRIYGRVRVGGQVIWATEFEEERVIERSGSSGGKSTGGGQKSVRYTYFANVAIGLSEGPISLVRRIWADGKPLDMAGITMRFYNGDEQQQPDPLIVAKQETGDVPAFRGLAYVVFERLPLADYGNRLPQFSFELVRAGNGLPQMLKAINIIPGSTEFGYASAEVREDFGYGNSRALNRAQWTHATDWEASLDALQAVCPNLERATLINAWFGDDLRAGSCTLRPKTEKSTKATIGAEWSCAGLTRASAQAVSADGDRPNYGGSPSDASVIAALRDVKARGLKVALHPFVLMDIPGGNTKPDPYTGAAAQPAFPWRGRITCDPAPERAGTPENSSAVTAQITAFFGSANAAHFSRVGDVITYAGPNEWSYRRFVLHQAMLAQTAGGVDTFFLGSELVGLTRLSSGNGVYPAVQALIALAGEVRAILGATTTITYAADWSEYGAHVRSGGQEVRFPLDPLWADTNIGAVAIDFYPPLSDWRAGRDHLDADEAYSAVDGDYLKARIGAGEAFDWYYANKAGRAAQTRLPIADGAFNKPWIYRAKDIKNWWMNAHKERVAGVELTSPTAWVAQSKPILLAEIGCPAVDKGGNQPNVFPDPKSIENALPYFSTGARDDLVQRRVLEAMISRFDADAPGFDTAHNPISNVYGGRMVQADFIAPWAYDARPFPAFPMLKSLWADGENWSRGHWLNGRIEAVPVADLICMVMADHGHAAPLLANVDGIVDGYVIDRPMSARAALEPLANVFGLVLTPNGENIRLAGRSVAPVVTLTRADLVAEGDAPELDITRAQESDLPRAVSFGFADSERDFRKSVVSARKDDSAARREVAEEAAIIVPRGQARHLVETRLADLWAGRDVFKFRLRPNARAVDVGDLVALETANGPRHVLITRISDAKGRLCEGRAFDPDLADSVPISDDGMPEPGVPALPGAAYARLLEVPLERGDGAGPVAIAVRAEPWRGPYSVSRVDGAGLGQSLPAIVAPARIGQTLTALQSGPLWRWDHQASVDIRLESGAISSLGEEAVLAGGNALLLLDNAGESEIILFRFAQLIGEKRYRLSGLLRGIGLSEGAAGRNLAPGAECILLDDSVTDLGLGVETIGQQIETLVVPAGRDVGDATAIRKSITPLGRGLRPLSPVHARAKREAGGLRLSFIRRVRSGGDSLDLYEVPLGEEREEYRLEILSGAVVKRNLSLATSDYLYPSADELEDFGAAQTALSVRVAQISARVGPGDALNAIVPVT